MCNDGSPSYSPTACPSSRRPRTQYCTGALTRGRRVEPRLSLKDALYVATMSAARAIERIRPYIPLIKFRYLKGPMGPVTVGDSKAKSNSSPMKGSTRQGDSIEFTSLPQKYRRLAITPEEVDYINRGGPE